MRENKCIRTALWIATCYKFNRIDKLYTVVKNTSYKRV
jgi:hypothetical protein